MKKIKIGILGYGNLGKGVEEAVKRQQDMELAGIFSRRRLNHPLAFPVELLEQETELDVLILCTGSATDLPVQTPKFAKMYNVVDSFDHHQKIEEHYKNVDAAAREGARLALISCGWDPGLFSMIRGLFTAILPAPPESNVFTFWGRGISQGHSDAIRRIKGVKDARQYTVPLESAVEAVKSGAVSSDEMPATEMHRRECYVVIEEGANQKAIQEQIKAMPDYFAGYETIVHFISQEKLDNEHGDFPHGGSVIGVGNGVTGSFQLELSSNPDFTASILVSYARAVYQMRQEGETGCRTVLEIPFKKLCDDMFIHM